MITISSKGDFKLTKKFLMRVQRKEFFRGLSKYGDQGVSALRKSTPKDTGETSQDWTYEIVLKSNSLSITWSNSNVVNGVPVAILLQYGHGTGTGGYVQGIDYINPAMRPTFEKILEDVWKEVTKE